jgi:hypothetical protein
MIIKGVTTAATDLETEDPMAATDKKEHRPTLLSNVQVAPVEKYIQVWYGAVVLSKNLMGQPRGRWENERRS